MTHSRPTRDIHCQPSAGFVLLNDRQSQRRPNFVPLTYGPKLVKTSNRQFSSLLQQRRRPLHFIPPGSRGLGWVRILKEYIYAPDMSYQKRFWD